MRRSALHAGGSELSLPPCPGGQSHVEIVARDEGSGIADLAGQGDITDDTAAMLWSIDSHLSHVIVRLAGAGRWARRPSSAA